MSYDKSFIEVQFPVSKISKESYKERKANLGQTLTGLGKWWGRKPLILVRAALLGLLIPSTDDPKRDNEIFLKILSMDTDGLLARKEKSIPIKDLYNVLSKKECEKYFDVNNTKIKYKKGISKEEKDFIQQIAFNNMTYDKKLEYCVRPEEIKNISLKAWDDINKYLGTNATCIQELIEELGIKKFGNKPIVGDCFSGGGSIPFEAARVGTKVYASDLNPIATLLTWADLNIASELDAEILKLKDFQLEVYKYVEDKVLELGIEQNSENQRADYYFYCTETYCPECGYKVPLSSSWIICKGTKTVAILESNKNNGFDIEIVTNATANQIEKATNLITFRNNSVCCPNCKSETPMSFIRKEDKSGNALRAWGKNDFVPHHRDILQERLYCVRYVKEYYDEAGKLQKQKLYRKPTQGDINREDIVKNFVREKFDLWAEKGYIPCVPIELGDETTRLLREKGWTYWHHLFNPRQLCIHALFMEGIDNLSNNAKEKVIGLLGIHKLCDWNAKLSIWNADGANEKGQQVFSNQALNTLNNYATRTTTSLKTTWFYNINNCEFEADYKLKQCDARVVDDICNIWITDPPYADAVNYHELSEFFLAWDKKVMKSIFSEWYVDSKRILAVRGKGHTFNVSMSEIYKNLCKNMTDDGYQIVMFTHQDVGVWAELSMILWSAGLQVTAAWNISTETESGGLKNGNYVKGTVLLVLKKQSSNKTAYLDELYSEIEEEVREQINQMRGIDHKEDPNFSDPDYLLAAYAASLKILTSYKNIEDIDVKYELSKARNTSEISPIENIINQAVKIAYDYLIPSEFDSFIWKSLIPEERLYLKGIELEKQNLYQLAAYQELARGFGVDEYTTMLASTKANTARLKTPKEFAVKNLNDSSTFGNSLLRNILVAIHLGLKEEDTSKGRNWLKTEVTDYWNKRSSIIEILNYLSKAEYIDNMKHWKECAHEAFILMNLVENDNI